MLEGRGAEAVDAGDGEILADGVDGAGMGCGRGEIDGAGEVLEDEGLEAEAGGGGGGVADAEVEGEADEEEARELTLAEVGREAGGCDAIVLEEGGVAVDAGAEAFAEEEFGVGQVEIGVESGAGGALQAVIRPESLRAVGGG